MRSDQRYMKPGRSHGSTWFFVLNIPPDLRGHPRFMTNRGKPMTKITESLGTKDPDKAREIRDQKLAYWHRQFRMMREGPSDEDIQEEAIALYRAAVAARKSTDLEFSALQAKRLNLPDDYLERLDRAIEISAADHIAEFCGRIGIQLQPKTDPYRKIGKEFLTVLTAAGALSGMLPLPDGQLLLGWRQQPLPQIAPPVPSERTPLPRPLPAPEEGSETFSEAFERYLATELDGTSEDTIRDYRRKVKVFTDNVGDLPLAKITDHKAVAFLDDYLLTERKQTPTTRNTYAVLFAAVFKCAIRRKKTRDNPFEGQRIKQVTAHYEPFTDQEIAALFADAKLEIAPAQYDTATVLPWVSLIAAYTGCRLEEAASLKVADIKETDGIWYFHFCPNGNGKTKAATRVVPLHHELVNAGLLRYRDTLPKESVLFPGLKGKNSKPGKLGPKLGDAFFRWRKRLGIVRPGVNFHSFRHTVGDRLRKAGVQESDIAAVLGHEDERITSRVYGHDGPGLQRLQVIIEKLGYAR
jgi:integrase